MQYNWLLIIGSTLAGLAWTTFVVWYWLRARWWKVAIGRNTMWLSMLLAITFDRLALVTWLVHTGTKSSSWQIYSGVMTYLIATALAVQKTYQMEKAQRSPVAHNRRKDDPKN